MALFTLWEIVSIIITIFAIGYILSGFIKKPVKNSIEYIPKSRIFNWEDVKYAAMITAPAVILHELAHKFTALSYGYPAYYQMIWWGLGIGIVLRLVGSRFIFFIPGAVFIAPAVINFPMTYAVIAFAGPAVNLSLFIASWYLLKINAFPKWTHALYISKLINLWLFIFNMLPIPPLDGSKVYYGLAAGLGII